MFLDVKTPKHHRIHLVFQLVKHKPRWTVAFLPGKHSLAALKCNECSPLVNLVNARCTVSPTRVCTAALLATTQPGIIRWTCQPVCVCVRVWRLCDTCGQLYVCSQGRWRISQSFSKQLRSHLTPASMVGPLRTSWRHRSDFLPTASVSYRLL